MTDTSVSSSLELSLNWEMVDRTLLKLMATQRTTVSRTSVSRVVLLPMTPDLDEMVGVAKFESSILVKSFELLGSAQDIFAQTLVRFMLCSVEKELTTWVIHSNGLIEIGVGDMALEICKCGHFKKSHDWFRNRLLCNVCVKCKDYDENTAFNKEVK